MAVSITRKARTSRSVDPATIKGREALDKLFKSKATEVPVKDDAGKVIETLSAHIVTTEMVGKSPTYTGLYGFVRSWAKDRGHENAVRLSKCDGGEIAILKK